MTEASYKKVWKNTHQRNKTSSPVGNKNNYSIIQLVMAKNRSILKLIYYN